MARFGFEQDDEDPRVDLSGLPPAKKKRPSSVSKEKVIKDSEKLGFEDRRPQSSLIGSAPEPFRRKPGRKPPSEPKKQVMISGPESVMVAFQKFCEDQGNLAYWEGLKQLMEKGTNDF